VKWEGRAHFFGAAAEGMRRILIESARRRGALRRGGGQQRLDIQEVEIASAMADEELLAVNEALEIFAALDPPKAELVKLRYFVGLTIEETAEVLGISVATAKRWWAYTRAWLYQETQGRPRLVSEFEPIRDGATGWQGRRSRHFRDCICVRKFYAAVPCIQLPDHSLPSSLSRRR